jgi:transcriptional regulator NrdR family protein
MNQAVIQAPAMSDDRGLRCWKCKAPRFRVIYTRPGAARSVMRRRECCQCGTRITTRERAIACGM